MRRFPSGETLALHGKRTRGKRPRLPWSHDHCLHTSPSNAPVRFTVGGVHVTKCAVGSMDNNAYLLDAGGPLLLIGRR